MKWLGNGGGGPEGDGIVKVNMDSVNSGMGGPQRSQDDATVGYVFQRPPDPEFPPFGPKQLRWTHGDDSGIIENQDKWKYPPAGQGAGSSASPSMQGPKIPTPPTGIHTGATHYGAALPSSLYDLGHSKQHMPQLAPEQLIYMPPGGHQLAAPSHGRLSLHHHYMQQQNLAAVQVAQQQSLRQVQQQHQVSHTVPRSYEAANMIAPSAKKLWGLETKDGKSLALNHLNHEGVWRDPTWAAPGEHAVSAPLAMGGRRGGFPGAGGDPGGILSPRGSDGPGGLGVKMVEYVLGTSPTGDKGGQIVQGLEPRMRALHLEDKDQKDGGKGQQSPKDGQDQVMNGQVNQQHMNGQDDDKGFNRTPGSRQPSPAEEDLHKNGVMTGGMGGLDPATMGLVLKQPPPVDGGGGPLHPHQHPLHHLPQHHPLGPHLGVTLAESVNQQFAEHFAETQQAAAGQGYDQNQHQQYAAQQQHQVDNAVLQQQQHNFDVQIPLTAMDWKKIAQDFEDRWNFPHCLGAMDGKHIAIVCPPNSGSKYFNYKQFFSIVLFAVTDAQYNFLYVHAGVQGRISDGGVFRHTAFGKALLSNTLNIPHAEPLSGREMLTPYVFLADDAFPLTENICKPYTIQLNIGSPKRVCNYRISRARRIVENSFGILASVFRVLHTTINVDLKYVQKIVMTCAYLHNFLRRNTKTQTIYAPPGTFVSEDISIGRVVPGSWRNDEQHLTNLQNLGRNATTKAKSMRDEFMHYFMTDRGRVAWQDKYLEGKT